MSQTPFSLAGFQVITIGRFWVIAEASTLPVKCWMASTRPTHRASFIVTSSRLTFLLPRADELRFWTSDWPKFAPTSEIRTGEEETVGDLSMQTTAGGTLGTLPYMSPEQALGKPLDTRTDLFSFGVTLYEMATGQMPFRGDTTGVLFLSIMQDVPVPAPQLNPKCLPRCRRSSRSVLKRTASFVTSTPQTSAATCDVCSAIVGPTGTPAVGNAVRESVGTYVSDPPVAASQHSDEGVADAPVATQQKHRPSRFWQGRRDQFSAQRPVSAGPCPRV